MPILIALFLVFLGIGWFETHEPRSCCLAHRTAEPVRPARSFQDRCTERFDNARLLLQAKGYAHDQNAVAHDEALWQGAHLRTDWNPGGGQGVLLTVDGPGGIRYAAGVSPGQPEGGQKYPEWYSFNKDGLSQVSLFKDRGDRSGIVAAVDDDAERRQDFVETMRKAVDDCLAMEP